MDIHQYDVGAKFQRTPHAVLPGSRNVDDGHVGLRVQHLTHRPHGDQTVLDDYDAQFVNRHRRQLIRGLEFVRGLPSPPQPSREAKLSDSGRPGPPSKPGRGSERAPGAWSDKQAPQEALYTACPLNRLRRWRLIRANRPTVVGGLALPLQLG